MRCASSPSSSIVVLGAHRHLGHFGLQACGFERHLHGLEVGRRGEHLDGAVVVGDHVLGAGFQRHFHDLVFGGAGRKDELAAVLELEGHRAFAAHVAAVLAEGVPHLGHRAHAVVGHAVDDDRRAADAVAFVADLLVAHAFEVAGGLVDVALDGVHRQVHRLGLLDGQPQPRVGAGVTAAQPRRDHDLADHARPGLAALFVLAALAVLDVGPFGVTGHAVPAFLR